MLSFARGSAGVDDGESRAHESCLQAIFFSEYVVRAWSEEFELRYLRSPVALIDFCPCCRRLGSF